MKTPLLPESKISVQACTRCLMPSTYPGIAFDANGVCNHCRKFVKQEPLGRQKLLEAINPGRGRNYDVLIGISGGKDSCYVAYFAKRELNLRVLAVSYDFPFMVDLARSNIRAVCESLAVEYRIVRTKRNLEYRLLRNHLMSLLKTGTTWGQCMFCHYGIEAILRKVAMEEGIPVMLSGTTSNELWWDPGNRTKFLFDRVKRLTLLEKAGFAWRQSRAYACLVEQRRQFPIPGNSALSAYRRPALPQSGPRAIRMFDYVAWDQKEIEETLMREAGWRKPDKAISWRYDCILEPLLDYTYKKEFGISSTGLYLCGLIRSGIMNRDEAEGIRARSEDGQLLTKCVRDVFKFLNLSPQSADVFLAH
ncbi:MAG TPA: asparagine synthase-related protein [Chitinivibrionales bacterium]|nr:asparagine synthase-related protein [Chitinivibrionales bacterium]